jgi:hypothetical protein
MYPPPHMRCIQVIVQGINAQQQTSLKHGDGGGGGEVGGGEGGVGTVPDDPNQPGWMKVCVCVCVCC